MTTIAMVADVSHVLMLSNQLNDQRQEGGSCDILLKVKGKTLPTHSCVLTAVSPFFRELIDTERCRSNSRTRTPQKIDLIVPGVTADQVIDKEGGGLDALMDLLDYMYTGKIELKEESVGLVVKMAEAFMLNGLLALIKTHMNDLDLPNSAAVPLKKRKIVPANKQPVAKRVRQSKCSLSKVSNNGTLESNDKVRTQSPKTKSSNASSLTPTRVSSRLSLSRSKYTVISDETTDPPANLATRSDDEAATSPTQDTDEMKVKRRRRKPDEVEKRVFRMSRTKTVPFTCRSCGFESRERDAVRDHLTIHPGSSYVCVSCDFVSQYSSKLMAHLREADHCDQTKCSLCFHEADDADGLRDHLKIHEHELPFHCSYCERRYPSRWGWQSHLRTHTNQRPFICSICNEPFKHNVLLRAHCAKQHSGGEFRPTRKYARRYLKIKMCEICGFTSPYSHKMKQHQREHTGDLFECLQPGCSYKSSSKHLLQSHMLSHSDEKKHQCEVCGKSYKDPGSFRQHCLTHNREANLIRCALCSFASLKLCKVRRHIERKHDVNSDSVSDHVVRPKSRVVGQRREKPGDEVKKDETDDTGETKEESADALESVKECDGNEVVKECDGNEVVEECDGNDEVVKECDGNEVEPSLETVPKFDIAAADEG